MSKDIDPITLAVIKNGLDSIVDEVAYTILRTARSEIVKDVMDYSAALCNKDGEMIAQAKPTGARAAVIGIAISGVQAMKTCLAEGVEPVGFEADQELGGFWRYKEEAQFPSVYLGES